MPSERNMLFIPLQTAILPLHLPPAWQNLLLLPIIEYRFFLQMKSALPPNVVLVSLVFFPWTGSGRLPQSTTKKSWNANIRARNSNSSFSLLYSKRVIPNISLIFFGQKPTKVEGWGKPGTTEISKLSLNEAYSIIGHKQTRICNNLS